jgi:hypothetical protein
VGKVNRDLAEAAILANPAIKSSTKMSITLCSILVFATRKVRPFLFIAPQSNVELGNVKLVTKKKRMSWDAKAEDP